MSLLHPAWETVLLLTITFLYTPAILFDNKFLNFYGLRLIIFSESSSDTQKICFLPDFYIRF